MVIEDRKKILFAFLIILLVIGGIGLWLFFGSRMSNPKNYGHIGEIPHQADMNASPAPIPATPNSYVRCP